MCRDEKENSLEISTQQFATVISEKFLSFPTKQKSIDDLWIYGREKGWLEAQDQLYGLDPIEKRSAARIVHEFLRIEKGIPDERDWSKAKVLEDLYHCRTCAKHVAQVYIKNIIPASSPNRFGLLKRINKEDLQWIINQMHLVISEQKEK